MKEETKKPLVVIPELGQPIMSNSTQIELFMQPPEEGWTAIEVYLVDYEISTKLVTMLLIFVDTDLPIGLALSGGGFRATVFHAGALLRLHELHMLSKIDTITSVSGGSIINGKKRKEETLSG
jgi:predicted acylesterase/phospholipase RssA